jgi:hypothetical protein
VDEESKRIERGVERERGEEINLIYYEKGK